MVFHPRTLRQSVGLELPRANRLRTEFVRRLSLCHLLRHARVIPIRL